MKEINWGYFFAVFGSIIGIAGGFIGSYNVLKQCKTQREKKIIIFFIIMITLIILASHITPYMQKGSRSWVRSE